MQRFFFLVLSAFILAACGGAQAEAEAQHPHWGYEGEAGPEHWGELETDYALCGTGGQQSPIDLNDADDADLANIEFHYASSEINILNNGHTIQVNYDPGSTISVDRHEYGLVQFHFHAPSEHTVDGTSYPAELHLVHADTEGVLAVVGILLDSGVENEALSSVWANLPAEETEAVAIGESVDASQFLPADQTTYRHAGSLTTTP
jgi:carbonic anhydrase